MTDYRKGLLDKIAEEQGAKSPITLAFFRMSDLYPKSCHDTMIADFYSVWRYFEGQKEQDEIPEDNMNQDADSFEDILSMVYEESGWDE